MWNTSRFATGFPVIVSHATIRGFIVLLAAHSSIDLQFEGIPKRLTPRVVKRETTVIGEDVLTYFALPARSARTIASIGAALLIGLSGSVPSQAQDELSSAERCLSANFNVSLGAQLPRTAARLNSGEPLKIVAIGSSSTVGLWVLRSAATYPEVMRRELSRLRSNATIKVINNGRIGDTILNNIARFERDVFAHATAAHSG
jgi:hypothetical protein